MDRKLRIVIITPSFPIREQPYKGQPIYKTACALQAFADVEVICINSCYSKWFLPSRFDYRQVDPSYKPANVHTHYLSYKAIPGLTRGINGYLCARAAEPLVRELKPDVILNYWLYPDGYAAVVLGRKLGIPAIVGSVGSDLNRIDDPISRRLTSITLQRAAFTLTKSSHLRQQAIRMGAEPARVRTVLNGCDTSIFKVRNRKQTQADLGIEQEATHILYVGRMEIQKGIYELLEAFAKLAKDQPNLRLTYIGDGPELLVLQEQISRRGLLDCVQLLGAKDSQSVAQWLGASDVFCLPSYAEGCPNAILEALSCGCPVVATNVGGIPEIVNEQCSILVPPRDASALAKALQSALAREWDTGLIAQQFRRSWGDVAREVYGTCCDAIEPRRLQNNDKTDVAKVDQISNFSGARR